MTVEIYKGRHFTHGHERKALCRFVNEMKTRFDDPELLYFVLYEIDCNGADIDLLILSHNSIIIADLKELTGVDEKEIENYEIEGKENGGWKYRNINTNKEFPMGGTDKNPYKQLKRNRYRFSEWLLPKIKNISNERWDEVKLLNNLCAWAVISPGFNKKINKLDLPKDIIKNRKDWFNVLSLDDFTNEINFTTFHDLKFTERELRIIINETGAERVTNLGLISRDYFRDDMPAVPHTPLFTGLSETSSLSGREKIVNKIVSSLLEEEVAIISITGIGGIGKTPIIGCVSHKANQLGWQRKYITCKEKDLTLELFLAGVASEIEDRFFAHLILDEKVSVEDRLDQALGYLESKKTLLIIDDFHKLSKPNEINKLIKRIQNFNNNNLKTIVISRQIPQFVNEPDIHPGFIRNYQIPGLQIQDINQLFPEPKWANLTSKDYSWIHHKTGGNPYAIMLLKPLMSKYGIDNEKIDELHVFESGKNQWFESLTETLEKEALQLAQKLSVIRGDLSRELICFMLHDPLKAIDLINELEEKYILEITGKDGVYTIYEFLREYLFVRFSDQAQKKKAHFDAAKFFIKASSESKDKYLKTDYLYEAIYHLVELEKPEEQGNILLYADEVYKALFSTGDRKRIEFVVRSALRAAQTKKDSLASSLWLYRLADWEFDNENIKVAGNLLRQALVNIENLSAKEKLSDEKKVLETKANILLRKGRLSYYVSEFDGARNHLVETLEIINAINNNDLKTICLLRLARLERHAGNFDKSINLLNDAKKISEDNDNYPLMIEAMSHTALIYRQLEDFEKAHEIFENSYLLAEKIQDWRGMEVNRSLIADLYRRQGKYEEASQLFKECLNSAREHGNGIGIRVNLGQFAECLIRLGRTDEAKPYLEEAQERCEKSRDGIGIAWTQFRYGLLAKKIGKQAEGEKLILEGIDKLHEIGSEVYIADFEKELTPKQDELPGIAY